jgi:hypothetical protein
MKQSTVLISGIATLLVIVVVYAASGLWRGLDAIRRFPEETAIAMQPVLKSAYQHRAATGKWPASLDEVGAGDVVMPRLASAPDMVIFESGIQIRVHGPGHRFVSIVLSDDEKLRQDFWELHGEGVSGEIRCPAQPW